MPTLCNWPAYERPRIATEFHSCRRQNEQAAGQAAEHEYLYWEHQRVAVRQGPWKAIRPRVQRGSSNLADDISERGTLPPSIGSFQNCKALPPLISVENRQVYDRALVGRRTATTLATTGNPKKKA
jgi:hypothetical protein